MSVNYDWVWAWDDDNNVKCLWVGNVLQWLKMHMNALAHILHIHYNNFGKIGSPREKKPEMIV